MSVSEVRRPTRQVSWAPKVRQPRITQDGSVEYKQIKLEDLSSFEDLLPPERRGTSSLYKALWTREDGSKKEVATKRLAELNEREVRCAKFMKL